MNCSDCEYARLMVKNEENINDFWIELAKAGIFDEKLIFYPFTTPGGIYIDMDGKYTQAIGVAPRQIMVTEDDFFDPNEAAEKITNYLAKTKKDNPRCKIAFCPYEIRVSKWMDGLQVVMRYGIHAYTSKSEKQHERVRRQR